MKLDMKEVEITKADPQSIEGFSTNEDVVAGLLCAAIFGDRVEMNGRDYKIVELHLEATRKVVFVMEIFLNAKKAR